MSAVAAGALASAMTLMTKLESLPATVTGSAFRPAGSPLILTVTGASNDPLRMIFPFSSTVVPGLISSCLCRELERGRRHDVERHGGQVENPVGAAELSPWPEAPASTFPGAQPPPRSP